MKRWFIAFALLLFSPVLFAAADSPLSVNRTNITLTEGGASAIVNVQLTSAPTGQITVTPLFDASQVAVSPATRRLDESNWNTGKNFTFTALDDSLPEAVWHGAIAFHLSVGGETEALISLIVEDNDSGATETATTTFTPTNTLEMSTPTETATSTPSATELPPTATDTTVPTDTSMPTLTATIASGELEVGDYLRVDPNDPRGLVDEDGNPFYPLGFGDCINVPTNDDDYLNEDWGFDGATTGENYEPFPIYWEAAQAAGINTFRVSHSNCSPQIFKITSANIITYNTVNEQRYLTLVRALRARGIRIVFVLFGFQTVPGIGLGGSNDAAAMAAVCTAVTTVVTAFADVVDMWEILNEKTAKDEAWYTQVIDCIYNADPHDHPISTSWEQEDNPLFSFDAPHDYQTEALTLSDNRVWDFRAEFYDTERPLLFGEWGNTTCNWDVASADRLRVHAWMSVFSRVGLIWWNSSFRRGYCPTTTNAANIYYGPDERAALSSAATFAGDLPAGTTILTVASDGAIDAYALDTPDGEAVYVVADEAGIITDGMITLAVDAAGIATWSDPLTGVVIETLSISEGMQAIYVPDFEEDIVLTIEGA